MLVINNHRPKRPNSTNTLALRPSTYDSVVIDVQEADGYAPGNAVDIFYRLTSATGKIFDKSERFLIRNRPNDREKKFFDYLEDHGIDIYDDLGNLNNFIGCHERLKLAYEAKSSGAFLNIVEREFVSRPPMAGGTSDVSGA